MLTTYALIIEDGEHMQSVVQSVDETFRQWGLEMSIKKTKTMPKPKGTPAAIEQSQ